VTTGIPVARLSRRWQIAASHRLYAASYDEAWNLSVYGKCSNPHGHGHTYTIEVTLAGPVDLVTGMVTNLADLDRFAQAEVIDRFDHQNLNLLPEFCELVPTTENFAMVIRRIFAAYPLAMLERVHVEETANNSFDVLTDAGARGRMAARER
jgi:6-pyruvoyltetrahydropterin/6-carboxytetrahydropterin synthase